LLSTISYAHPRLSPGAADHSSNHIQVCPYCYVDHCELLDALATVAASNLNIDFDIEHRPFKLISTKCLCEKKTVEKRAFYVSQLGEEKWARMEKSIGAWMERKGINMYVHHCV
jgi:predicted DsbA family dithiol-disulfide isomerase